MGKGSRQRRHSAINSLFSSAPCNGKDGEKVFQCTKDNDKDDEICKLRELNLKLIRDTNTSRQDLKACFLPKVAKMESQIHILEIASTNFESKIDNELMQQVKIGEQLSDNLMEIDKEFREQLAKRDEEYEAGISKARQQWHEAEERLKREISEKEEECRAVVSDKQTVETNVLQLRDKMKVMSAEFEAARKAWEMEKEDIFSQLVAARKEAEEIAKGKEIAEQAWNADKEYHLSELGRTYEKKIEDMSTQNERVLLEKIELESQLNDSKARTLELLDNFEEERNSWNFEKQKLQGNVAELRLEIDSMVSERELLCHQNTELNTEAESLKTQLNEMIARLAQMEDERVQNERVLQQCRTENIDLQSSLHDSKEKTQALLRKIEEDTHLWDAEKNNLKGAIAELTVKHESMACEMGSLTQKNRELTVEAEFVKGKANELESELDESKKRIRELNEKIEDDQHLWDQKKSNLEGTIADLQTKHEDLMLQLSRNKSVEEELLSTMSYLEDMTASTSKGEVEIANLKSLLLTVTEERDGQLSDIQRQLSAMEEGKKIQLDSLEDQLSSIAAGKRILEEENESLQTELASRTLIAKEEQVRLEGIVRKLQTRFNSLNKEIESSKAVAEEKEKLFVDLQNRYSDFVEAKNCVEKKNDSLLTELERCTIASDENIRLQKRISELEATVDSLKQDIESKDNHLQKKLLSQRQPLRKPLIPVGNGTPKQNAVLNEKPKAKQNAVLNEKPIPKAVVPENGKSKVVPENGKSLNEKPIPKAVVPENGKSKVVPENGKSLNEKPIPKAVVPENGKSKVVPENGKSKVTLGKGTPQKSELNPRPSGVLPQNGKSYVTLERGAPKVTLERGTPQRRELRQPTPKAAVPEKRSPHLGPQRPTPKQSQ